jgi:nucleotide-binding universal stress UspA family protein
MITLKNILVTTDLSDHSLAALEYASTLSILYGANLYLLHVKDLSPPPMYGVHLPDFGAERFVQETLEEGVRDLEAFTRNNLSPDLRFTPVVRVGRPVEEINRFARDENVDLIVMATHGWTGLKHVLLGSVAEKVVRTSPVPVLTVKPRQIRDRIISQEDVESELHMR